MVAKYGYLATLVGTLLEGETFLILSGLAASRGYLDISVLYAVGALITDSFFCLGPRLRPRNSHSLPAPGAHRRARTRNRRAPASTAVIGARFLYGMRTVGPAVIGAGKIALTRFVVLDVIAAVLWSFCWISVGYLLGEAVTQLLVNGPSRSTKRWAVAAGALGSANGAAIDPSQKRGRSTALEAGPAKGAVRREALGSCEFEPRPSRLRRPGSSRLVLDAILYRTTKAGGFP